MSDYLIVGDVDHVQDYVFASGRLRAIRGASALLDQAAQQIASGPLQKNILRWRGGQIVARLDKASDGRAQEICAEWERVFRDYSQGEATLTTGYTEYTGRFKDDIARVFQTVRREKDGRQSVGTQGQALLTSPYDRRCDLLPTTPAHARRHISAVGEADEFRYHSPAADARWEAVKEKIPFDEDLRKELANAGVGQGQDYRFPHSPEELWREETEGQYIALVMADGNGFGQMLEWIDDATLYRDFSEELYALTLAAVARAANAARIDGQTIFLKHGDKLLPLVPIILAGDDLSLLVRKEHAIPFAHALCKEFCKLSKNASYRSIPQVIACFRKSEAGRKLFPKNDPSQWQLTLSASVAIAKRKFPITALRRLAGDLRKQAKSELRRQWDAVVAEQGIIDFAVVTTATVQPLETLRRGYYHVDESPGLPKDDLQKRWTVLTERPYTIERLKQLEKLAGALKPIPRSKRKFLYTELFKGEDAGAEAYRFVLARERERRKDVERALEAMGLSAATVSKTPFREDVRTTPLVDALELAELL